MALLLKELLPHAYPNKQFGTFDPDEKDEEAKLREVIKRKCPVAYDQFKKGVRIMRGYPRGARWEPYFYVNPQRKNRSSANTHNYYTLIIDNDPSWKAFPPRSKSLISTVSEHTASTYGNPYYVFPVGDPIVGLCPEPDFWFSFTETMNRMFKERRATPNDMNYVMHSLARIEGVELSQTSYEELVGGMEELSHRIQMSRDGSYNDLMISHAPRGVVERMISYVKNSHKDNPLLHIYQALLNPHANNFESKKLSQLTEADMESGEVWLSAPSILVTVKTIGNQI
jgi:hypothetical protein